MPRWRAEANSSPWSKDKVQLLEPGSALRALVLPRGMTEAANLQQDPVSFTHLGTVLELVHLGCQRAVLNKHHFANAAHSTACCGSFP